MHSRARSANNRLLFLNLIPCQQIAQQSFGASGIPARFGVPFRKRAAVQSQFAPAFPAARLANWNREERVLSGRLDDFVMPSRVLPADEILAFS